VVPALLAALSDADEDVRMYALRALQGTEDPRVRVPLIYALKDPHAQVRAEAVSHLRKIGDPDAGVCREVVLLLGEIGGERTEFILQDLEGRTHDPLKLAAVRTARDQVSRMSRAGSGVRGGPLGPGTADRVVISRKKDVEPAPPHTRMATPQTEPEAAPAGDFSECLPLWETDPPAARAWQHLLDTAGDFLDREDFAAALPLLERARDLYPDSELLLTRLELTLSGLGRYGEALRVYTRGIALNPKNDAFWSNAGALLANLERYDEALQSYKQALALCMSDGKVWYQTGIVLNNLGRYAEAVKCFDRALLLDPAFPEAAEARRIARGNVGGDPVRDVKK